MSPRPARPDLREQKAAEIVRAAALVFCENGYQRTRVADVAERAGVGKGTIYEYFRTKEDLFLAVFDGWEQDALRGGIEAAEPCEDAVTALRAFFAQTFTSLKEILPAFPLTLEFWAAAAGSELGDRLGEQFRRLYGSYSEVVAGMIAAGVDSGAFRATEPPLDLARVLVGALDGIFIQAWLDPAFDAETAGRHFVEVFLRGLADATENPS